MPVRCCLNPDLVTAVIDAETFREFEDWRRQQKKSSLADYFAELRQLCAEENYSPEVPDRCDRNNIFTEIQDELSL